MYQNNTFRIYIYVLHWDISPDIKKRHSHLKKIVGFKGKLSKKKYKETMEIGGE